MTSILKRRKLREQELKEVKDNLYNSLPNLTSREVRRHRIPYHMALCMELDEDGFFESSTFLRSLVEYQDEFRKKAGEDSALWQKPVLKDDRDAFTRLFHALRAAEEGMKANRINIECDQLLEIGVYFSKQPDSWWWLTEQLLQACVRTSSSYVDDGGKRNALSRYVFGRFLLNVLNNAEAAKEHLTVCRELSAGQKWTAKHLLAIPQENLFKECCFLLYQALLIVAKTLIAKHPKEATRMVNLAYKRSVEAEDNTGEMKCLMQLGACHMLIGNPGAAQKVFKKALSMNISIANVEGVCEARIHFALALAKMNLIKDAYYNLNVMMEYALKNDSKFYEAQAFRYLGELHMFNGEPLAAGKYLMQAMDIFHDLEDFVNREIVKNYACISKGLELCIPYRALIRSSTAGSANLNRLISWKDTRAKFIDDLHVDSDMSQDYSVRDMLYGEMSQHEAYDEMASDEMSQVTQDSMEVDAEHLRNAIILDVSEQMAAED